MALSLLLAWIYGLGVWWFFAARAEADLLARRDLQLQAAAQARAIEAALASIRGDFLFLAQSAPFSSIGRADDADPVARRWTRLDVEAAALLFLAAHPEVDRIQVWEGPRKAFLVAGRRDGAPVLLPPASALVAEAFEDSLRGSWPLRPDQPEQGRLEAVLRADPLVARVAPGDSSRWRLLHESRDSAQELAEAGAAVSAEVSPEGWTPAAGWRVERPAAGSQQFGTARLLAQRHRATVILGLGLLSLALPLAWIAFRQTRRRWQLEAERVQQERIQQLERQVWHSERLASLGRLAAGMAHEINNPLEGMSNYLGILSRELQQRREGELVKVAGRLRDGLERVAGTVSQVLTFADPGQAHLEEVDLREVLTRTFDFVRSNPSFRHLSLSLDLPSEPLRIRGNPVMLGQLFLNLMLNACQVQEKEGEVAVDCRAELSEAVATVADRGPGVAPEDARQIFEPFFSRRGSAGLGLSVCLGIVTFHGGSISFENRPRGGARMLVRLPRGLEQADSAPAPALAGGARP